MKKRSRATSSSTPRAEEVLRRLRSVPEGYVTTYGDLSPGSPRYAGAVLSQTDEDVPWHRAVRADGSLTKGDRQRALLEAEDVPFLRAKVDMKEAQIPEDAL